MDEELQKEQQPQDSSALSKLKRRLADLRANEDGYLYETEEERIQKTEKAIAIFIKSAMENQLCSTSFVKRKLTDLYNKDFLIHKEEILQYGISEVEKFNHEKRAEQSTLPEQSQKSQPIFCKENIYHACLCCEAVGKCTHENVKAFFEDKVQSHDHNLEEASMSISDHYLIAKSQNTFIISFNGEKNFTSWFEICEKEQCGYRFEKGLEPQAKEVPFRFLVKQLLVEKNRVIFTGFSSGGLIACMVSSMLWKDNSFIGSDELKANTMCLTFGQPIINMPCISDLVQKYPDFTATLHQVYLKSDLIPQIFLCAASRQISLVITDKKKLLHYKPFLHYLGELQRFYFDESASLPCDELKKLKEIILANTSELIIQGDEWPFQIIGNQYLINVKSGLSWKQLAPENMQKELGPLKFSEIESLSCEDLFKKHNTQEYLSSVFASYLDKPPQLKFTDPARTVSEVAMAKLVANSIAFHQHGKELAITLEGDNLWFVHSIQVGSLQKLSVCPMATNQKSVQFNLQCKPDELAVTADQVKVVVESQFCEPISSSLKVTKKLYEITARQEQLAKHKPSEIIELAFLSALLEQRLSDKSRQSPKMRIIRNFLEEVVKLVPLESLFYALGCGDDDIIEDCCEAFVTSDLPYEQFAPSEMLLNGMNLALQRLATGQRFHEQDFQRPNTFSSRIVNMLLRTRHLLDGEDSDTPSGPYVWPTQHHRVLYSEVVASQRSSQLSRPRHFTHPNESSHKPKPEGKNKKSASKRTSFPPANPNQSTSCNKQTKPKRRVASGSSAGQGQQRKSTQRSVASCQPGIEIPIPVPVYGPSVMVYSHFHSFNSYQSSNISSYQREVIEYLTDYLEAQTYICLDAITSIPISSVYPAALRSHTCSAVMPPIDLLSHTRAELEKLAKGAVTAEKAEQDGLHGGGSPSSHTSKAKAKLAQKLSGTTLHNKRMLDMITDIRKKQKVCSTLLGAFMEAQVRVPLVKSVRDTAQAIGKTAIAVGVWALLSMPYFDMESLLSVKFSSLFVEVARFIHGTYSGSGQARDVGDEYAGKLQFLLQGMETTVSCNSRYISYSLEQQLQEQCNKLNIDASTKVQKLIDDWDVIFNRDVLSLVTPQSRGLVARWLKWSLLIHNLREELAKYTSVGIVGLVNSGKSKLVSSLFSIPVPAGTRESKRTTIPFIYNLGQDLTGIDVIDFPGVDDRDETIPELAELLLSLAQIVVFVVDYKKAHTKAAQEWLDRLAQENVYVLVCLTYADKLYAELMGTDGSHPKQDAAKSELIKQTELITDKLGQSPNRTVYLTTLSQDKDSTLNTDDGRRTLMKAGLKCCYDVGDWLAETFDSLQHHELAVKMTAYLEKKKKECRWYSNAAV